jgi:serine/threonine protein phosphatase 1
MPGDLFKQFAPNLDGRDFAVGDIHGCFTALDAALNELGFNRETDRLFSVGDLVDRGPESIQALDWLKFPWFHAVRGNHEQMAIDYGTGRDSGEYIYSQNGGAWNIANSLPVRREIAAVFDALPYAIEVQTETGLVGIVHAECPTDSWFELTGDLVDGRVHRYTDYLLWSRDRYNYQYTSEIQDVKAIIVGHTPHTTENLQFGNVHYIDTAGWHRTGLGFTFVELSTLNRTIIKPQKKETHNASES